MLKTKLKDGTWCRYYSNDQATGQRKIFTWRVSNRQDAIHCLVRMEQASGWFVQVINGTIKTNERIYSNMKKPGYQAPASQTTDPLSWVRDALGI